MNIFTRALAALMIALLMIVSVTAQTSPTTYVAQKTANDIIIDGKPNEDAWQGKEPYGRLTSSTSKVKRNRNTKPE